MTGLREDRGPVSAAHHGMHSHKSGDSNDLVIVFSWWKPSGIWEMALSAVAIFGMCIGFELLKVYVAEVSSELSQKKSKHDGRIEPRLKISVLSGIEYMISLFLMMVFMTLDLTLISAMFLGTVLGRYLFYDACLSPYISASCH